MVRNLLRYFERLSGGKDTLRRIALNSSLRMGRTWLGPLHFGGFIMVVVSAPTLISWDFRSFACSKESAPPKISSTYDSRTKRKL